MLVKLFALAKRLKGEYRIASKLYARNFGHAVQFKLQRPLSIHPLHITQSHLVISKFSTQTQSNLDDLTVNPINTCSAEKTEINKQNSYRTHTCGELRISDIGKDVTLSGWVSHTRLNNTFIILRDAYGSIQVTTKRNIPIKSKHREDGSEGKSKRKSSFNLALESIIQVKGKIVARPPAQIKNDMPTGEIEIAATDIILLNRNTNSCIPKLTHDFHYNHSDQPGVKDNIEFEKLRYRYAYLRSQSAQANLRARARFLAAVRAYLDAQGYVETETPALYKPTLSDMGAGEFLVPTTNLRALQQHLPTQNGEPATAKYYALTQSPQLLKQLLMVGGLDKYYQIAKCFRNEKRIHHARQPEFTQIDLEASFATQTDIRTLVEGMLVRAWPELLDTQPNSTSPLETPFPVLTYDYVLDNYGTDKPDLRDANELLLSKGTQTLPVQLLSERVFCDLMPSSKSVEHPKIYTTGLAMPRRQFIDLLNPNESHYTVKLEDKPGFYVLWCDGNRPEPLNLLRSKAQASARPNLYVSRAIDFETFSAEKRTPIDSTNIPPWLPHFERDSLTTAESVLLFNASFDLREAQTSLGKVRSALLSCSSTKKASLTTSSPHKFLWVVDFPLFQRNQSNIRPDALESVHHPFTAPAPEQRELLWQARFDVALALSLRAQHYDLVLNGEEIGGGSVRMHDPAEQKLVLEDILGSSVEENKEFDYFLEALSSGCPPHAGIALGLDRLVALARGTTSIRDVMAFPKSASGSDVLSGSPCNL